MQEYWCSSLYCIYCRQTPNKTSIRVCLRCYAFYDCLNGRRKLIRSTIDDDQIHTQLPYFIWFSWCIFIYWVHEYILFSLFFFCSIAVAYASSACFGFLFLSKSNSVLDSRYCASICVHKSCWECNALVFVLTCLFISKCWIPPIFQHWCGLNNIQYTYMLMGRVNVCVYIVISM